MATATTSLAWLIIYLLLQNRNPIGTACVIMAPTGLTITIFDAGFYLFFKAFYHYLHTYLHLDSSAHLHTVAPLARQQPVGDATHVDSSGCMCTGSQTLHDVCLYYKGGSRGVGAPPPPLQKKIQDIFSYNILPLRTFCVPPPILKPWICTWRPLLLLKAEQGCIAGGEGFGRHPTPTPTIKIDPCPINCLY